MFSYNKFYVGTINYAKVLLSRSGVYMHIVSKINWLVALAVLHADVLVSWSGVCMHIVSKINRHCGPCCPTCPCIYAVVM